MLAILPLLKEITMTNAKSDPGKTDRQAQDEAKGQKATQFDGSPNPQGTSSSALKPKDDTPMTLKKSEGPRDDQK